MVVLPSAIDGGQGAQPVQVRGLLPPLAAPPQPRLPHQVRAAPDAACQGPPCMQSAESWNLDRPISRTIVTEHSSTAAHDI